MKRFLKYALVALVAVGALSITTGHISAEAKTAEMKTGEDLQLAIDEAWDNETFVVKLPPKARIWIDKTIVNPGVSILGSRCGNPPELRWRGKGDGPIMRLDFYENVVDAYGHVAKNPLNLGLTLRDIMFVGNYKDGIRGRALESNRGFVHGCSLDHLFFWKCSGPVVRLANCWQSSIRDLVFHGTTGEALVLTQHNGGLLDGVLYRAKMGDEAARAAIVLNGSGADWRRISVDSSQWPGRPVILMQKGHASHLRVIRSENQVSETLLRLQDCNGCRVETIYGGFKYDTDALSVVDVRGGRGNKVIGVMGAFWRTLRPEGAIVTYRQEGEVEVESIFNQSEEPLHRPDLYRPDKRRIAGP